MHLINRALALLPWLLLPIRYVRAQIGCTTTSECVTRIRAGSECQSGICTNPYHKEGCLASYLRDQGKPGRIRVCHSEDPENAESQGICRKPVLDYPEIRILGPNWESALMTAWVMQVLLSELGDVPTTIEPSSPGLSLDFYDVNATFGYGVSVDVDAMRRASVFGDCRNVPKIAGDGSYQACAHVTPEMWGDLNHLIGDLLENGHLEPVQGIGALAAESWYIPYQTFQKHPSLVSYLGLRGENNRRKLAEIFLRPTTWGDFCSEVSNSSCSVPDEVAERAPQGEDEASRMFVKGVYTGYFRKTEENDCDKWPLNCTGHIGDYPCGWTSNVEPQTYHHRIALQSSGKQGRPRGYTAAQMVEIWEAANATNSDVIMMYWRPSVLTQQFADTPYALAKVYLPPPTLRCENNRVGGIDRCDARTDFDIYGDPVGACDQPPQILSNLVASSVFRLAKGPDVPPAQVSPAFDMIRNFRISEFEMGHILDGFVVKRTGDNGFDARDAVCTYVKENLETLQALLPPSFPRVIETNEKKFQNQLANVFVVWVSCVASLATIAAGFAAHGLSRTRVVQGFQVEFVASLVIGLGLVSAGAIMLSLWTTDFVCMAVEFLTNLGYVLELIPLSIEITAALRQIALHEFVSTVAVRKKTSVACLSMLVFLVTWAVLDPPKRSSSFNLSGEVNIQNETPLVETFFCASNDDYWNIIALSWQLILVFVVSVMSLQTGTIRGNKEIRIFILLTYSHLVFAGLRAISFFFRNVLGESRALGFRSIFLGLDVITTLSIYFIPKMFAHERQPERFSFAQAMSSHSMMGSSAWTFDERCSARNNLAGLSSSLRDKPSLRTMASDLLPVKERNEQREVQGEGVLSGNDSRLTQGTKDISSFANGAGDSSFAVAEESLQSTTDCPLFVSGSSHSLVDNPQKMRAIGEANSEEVHEDENLTLSGYPGAQNRRDESPSPVVQNDSTKPLQERIPSHDSIVIEPMPAGLVCNYDEETGHEDDKFEKPQKSTTENAQLEDSSVQHLTRNDTVAESTAISRRTLELDSNSKWEESTEFLDEGHQC